MSSHDYQVLPDSDPGSSQSPRLLSEGPRYRFLHFRQLAFIVATVILTFSLFSFHNAPHPARSLNPYDRNLTALPDDPFHPQPDFQPTGARTPHYPDTPQPYTSTQPPQADCDTPTSSHPFHQAPPSPLTFSLIMFSEDSAAEGAVLIKSIIMYSSRSLAFHIICDQDAQQYLDHRLHLLTRPQHDITVHFYRIPHESMVARIHREGALHTDHSAGVPGLMKLFIHEILPPSVERAIFVDTDAFFISDPAQLWDRFDALRPGAAISMPYHPDQNEPEWHNANRICSCIMLLDLKLLRELRLMDSEFYRQQQSINEGTEGARGGPGGPPALAPPAFEAMFGPPVPDGDSGRMKYDNVKLGDQGYWWAIVSHRQDIFEPLSFDWEVSSCLMDMYFTGLGQDDVDEEAEIRHQVHVKDTPDEGRAVLPKMLHFNCLDAERYYDWSKWTNPNDGLAQRWGPAVHYHVGFKWIWLNKLSSNATLVMETLHDVKFADEVSPQPGDQS